MRTLVRKASRFTLLKALNRILLSGSMYVHTFSVSRENLFFDE
jgi:hypothetical protein